MSRIRIRAKGHHLAMAFTEQVDEVIRCFRDAGHLHSVGHDGVGAEDVMAVGVSGRNRDSCRNDLPGLLKLEFRAFDVVREIAFEESEVGERLSETLISATEAMDVWFKAASNVPNSSMRDES